MDFFQRQDIARRHTKWLVVYFALAVVFITLTIYLVSVLVFTGVQTKLHQFEGDIHILWWNPKLFLGVTIGTLAVIIIGSLSKTMELAQGGSAVAAMFGGRLLNPGTTDPDERKLLNIVEEMSVASGTPMPQVFVLDDENSVNAFAAGHTTSDCAVTVTRGCMKMLSRDELQGVIGHEFSHILNGDMKLNLRLIGIIFGILCLTVVGRILLRTRGRKNPLPPLGIALIIVGGMGVFFGRLIQAAVSRQREFLADASSVQFTRNPSGLSGALQKIGRHGYGSHIASPQAEQASHMFFANGMGAPFTSLMATHPPIPDRIRAIDPTWDGKFPPLKPEQFETIQQAALSDFQRQSSRTPDIIGTLLTGAVLAEGTSRIKQAPPVIQSNTVLPSLGNITTAQLVYAADLRDSLPQALKDAAHEPLGAVTLIYGLLLSDHPATRKTQLAKLAAHLPQPVHDEMVRLLPDVSAVAARAKLALANIALPGLRQLSARQMQEFNDTMRFLIASDGQLDLFEYVLQKIVRRHLAPAQKSVTQFYSAKPLLPDCSVLLSAIAHTGQTDDASANKAFQRGAAYLRVQGGLVSLLPAAECGLEQIDAALDRLAQAAPQIKKNLIEACAQTVAADGMIQEMEAELLRAVADTLDCPIPPFVTVE